MLIEEYNKIISVFKDGINVLKSKNFIITGANGLIGSYLVNYLLFLNNTQNMDIKIIAISRNKNKLIEKFGPETQNLKFIEQDLSNNFELNIKSDYIIHAASNAHPVAYSTDPVGTMLCNFIGTRNLLECAKENNSRFLYISSGEIYGSNVDHNFTEDDLGYIDTKDYRACYPESKRAAETLCFAYNSQYNVSFNIARLSYVYGPTITDTNSRADAQFLRNALNCENIILKTEGLQKRTYCYVADVVSAMLYILLFGKDSEVYNISNMKSIVSIKEYAQTLADIANVKVVYDIPSQIEKKGYSKAKDSILDSNKLCNLGWKPNFTFKEGIEHTFFIIKATNNVFLNKDKTI
jgi:nucleoside-diphosphate-sugar epimerase